MSSDFGQISLQHHYLVSHYNMLQYKLKNKQYVISLNLFKPIVFNN